MQSVLTNGDLLDLKFMSRSAIAKDTWRSARQQLAPPLPMKLADPSLYSAPLKAHSAAPLTALARSDAALQVRTVAQHWMTYWAVADVVCSGACARAARGAYLLCISAASTPVDSLCYYKPLDCKHYASHHAFIPSTACLSCNHRVSSKLCQGCPVTA
jgi:hypothetical protein